MIALISDIHGNLEALQAVLKDIEQQSVDAIYCLGDIVGYGPNPLECLQLIQQCDRALLGNHEAAVLTSGFGFNSVAKSAIEWTRQQLKPSLCSLNKRKLWNYLNQLPSQYVDKDVLYVHASPREPVTEYLFEELCNNSGSGSTDTLEENFSLIEKLCFIGHTHRPGVINDKHRFLHIEDLNYNFTCNPDQKFIINIGSVGQPRDNDNRACYVLYDPEKQHVEFKRVTYDIQKTYDKIITIDALDNRLAERLKDGI